MNNELINVTITLNGEKVSAEVEPRMLLIHFIRDIMNATGSHIGCDTSQCGNCTILVDGRSTKSCTVLAVHADEKEVITVEGIGTTENLHPIQKAFWEEHGLQCGYCTPGAMMASIDFLSQNPDPTDDEIREGLDGIICRCTGYEFIVNAVRSAAKMMNDDSAVKGEV